MLSGCDSFMRLARFSALALSSDSHVCSDWSLEWVRFNSGARPGLNLCRRAEMDPRGRSAGWAFLAMMVCFSGLVCQVRSAVGLRGFSNFSLVVVIFVGVGNRVVCFRLTVGLADALSPINRRFLFLIRPVTLGF